MLKALVQKEWRQLALVRWGGVALGALLPAAFSVGAELARRGLLPIGSVSSYRPRDLMFEILPAALAFGPWPLVGLMAAASAFSGDRAAGTESFCLEPPVPRSLVWRARGIASFGSLVMVIVITGAVAAAGAVSTGDPTDIGWTRWLGLCGIGVGTAFLAFIGATLAASLLSSPMGSVLLGAILGAVPALLAAELMTFTHARMGEVPLGFVLPVILVPAYLGASWWALCRGQPAGRGRTRRALTVLGGALGTVLLLFVILTPICMRATANGGWHAVLPIPSGRAAFIASGGAGWGGGFLTDIGTGKKRAFIPPPIRDITSNPDGDQMAFVTWSGPLGSERSHERVEIRSSVDGALTRTIAVPEDLTITGIVWTDGGLIAVVLHVLAEQQRQFEIEVIDPARGTWRSTDFRTPRWNPVLVRSAAGHAVFARELVEVPTPEGGTRPIGYRLYPVDATAGHVGPVMSGPSGEPLVFEGWLGGLSPSRRFARVAAGDDPGNARRIVDLRSGAANDNPATPWAQWTVGDALIWQDRLEKKVRLFVAPPGTEPRAIREWQDATVGTRVSPDGRAVFVSVIQGGEPRIQDTSLRPTPASLFTGDVPRGTVPEEFVYLPEENRFLSLGAPFSDRPSDRRYTEWAGNRTLARIAPGVVAFEDIDAPGVRRFAIGDPSDLE